MSKSSTFDPRLNAVGRDSRLLAKDVDSLESALYLKKHLLDDGGTRGLLRKEIGGSRWQHGGEGKVLGYKSTKDLKDKYGLQSTKQNSSRPASAKKKTSNGQSNKKRPASATGPVEKHQPGQKISLGPDVYRVPQKQASVKKSAPATNTACPTSSLTPSHGDDILRDLGGADTGMGLKLEVALPGELSSLSDAESDHLFDPDFASKSFEDRHNEMRTKVLRKVISKIDKEKLESSIGKDSKLAEDIRMIQNEPQCDPEVLDWLKSLNLKDSDKYARSFAENEIDIDSLKLVTETQLRQMGITSIGPLNKMLFAIKDLRGENSDIEKFVEKSTKTKTTKTKAKEKSARTPNSPISLDVQGSTFGNLSSRSTKSTCSRELNTPKQQPQSAKSKTGRLGSDSAKGNIKTPNKTSNEGTRKKPVEAKFFSKKSRPVSGSVLIANKRQGVARRPASAVGPQTTNSAILTREIKCVAGKPNEEPASPDDESPLDERDLNISDFISVKTMVSDVPGEGTMAKDEDLSLRLPDSPKDSIGGSPLDRLLEIENHIVGLQKELENPQTMDLIGKLQSQLQEVQNSLVGKRLAAKTGGADPGIFPGPETTTASLGIVTDSRDSYSASMNQELSIDQEDFSIPLESGKSPVKRQSGPAHRQGVASMTMSKAELLKEVRKQKDAHRKQIRHLESELSRLKYKDPLRSCEIPIEDFTFNENGVLGEGGFSQVFHGFYQGSEVAIKRLKIPLSSQDKNYFAAEVSLLRELRHPRVVLLLGVNTTSSLPLMILEFMSGGSLHHHLHDPNLETLDHAAFYQIARDTALGMNYLHRHRPAVLHLDLKSMNVLLTNDLRAKIGDFGFSKLRHDAELSGKDKKLKGTPAWMSPELLDTGEISTKADVYSFSIILWEMVTRKRPYEGLSMFQVIQHARTNRRPDIPDSCPQELRLLISRCWDHNPAKRPSFKDIVAELEKLHFPQEWRILFTVSGVPPAAFDDVEATRSIINLVYDTMDHVRPEGVPSLDLNLNDSGEKPKIMDFSSSDSSGSDGGLLGSSGGRQEPGRKSQRQPSTRSSRVAWSEDYSSPPQVQHPKPMQSNYSLPPPPPVPPLDMRLFSSPEDQVPTRKTTSFLDDIKSGMKNLQLRPTLQGVTEEGVAPGKDKARGSGMDLRASQLVAQRGMLKDTEQPHPNQLRNLSGLSEAKLHDLAEVLRKAVSDRRIAMNAQDGNSVDQTLTHSGWSITDST